jgi:hypothetical protein
VVLLLVLLPLMHISWGSALGVLSLRHTSICCTATLSTSCIY